MALDIDISRVQAILTDLSGETVLAREQFPTQGEDFPRVYERVCHAVDRLLAQMPASQYGLVGMGVAVHGVVDLSGLIRFIPRRGWRNVDLRSLLAERYQVPVSLDNDGNLAALAQQELISGTGECLQSLAMVNIGDSISVGSSPTASCSGASTALPTPSATTPSILTSPCSAPAANMAAGSSTAPTAPDRLCQLCALPTHFFHSRAGGPHPPPGPHRAAGSGPLHHLPGRGADQHHLHL